MKFLIENIVEKKGEWLKGLGYWYYFIIMI